VRGLLLGAAAIGAPALANFVIAKRAQRLPAPRWGRATRYAWRHGDIVFRRLGEGPPLVLLHSFGIGHDSSEWLRAAELLAEDFTVFAVDLLGWGESDKPAMDYDGELYMQLIEDFLGDVVRRRAFVAAAGLPGAYVIQLAADLPDLFLGIALVGPGGIEVHGEEPDIKDAIVHRFLRLPVFGTAALNAYISRHGVEEYLKREVYASPERVDQALVERHYRASHQPGAKAPLAAYLAGYLNHNVEAQLRRVETPVWLAWGRHAHSPAIEAADLWLHRLRDATLEAFDACGNLPHAETPGLFTRKLRRFLLEVGTPEPAAT